MIWRKLVEWIIPSHRLPDRGTLYYADVSMVIWEKMQSITKNPFMREEEKVQQMLLLQSVDDAVWKIVKEQLGLTEEEKKVEEDAD